MSQLILPDIINIMLEYILSDIENIDIKEVKKSFQQIGNTLSLGSTSGVGTVQNFKTVSVRRSDDANGLTIVTKPLNGKKNRVRLNLATTKQLYKTLLNMHGIKGKVVVIRDDYDNGDYDFTTTISNLQPIEYEEVILPVHIYMGGNISRFFKKSKFLNLRKSIINEKRADKLKEVVLTSF